METAVADFLVTFENWLPLVNFDNDECIRRQWVELFLKKWASKLREARENGRRGNKRLATDLGERSGSKVSSNRRELPNPKFTVMIHWVSNGKDMVLAPKHLQALYTDVRHWEELVDFIDKNGGPKEPYILTSMLPVYLGAGRIGRRVYGNIQTWANDQRPDIWPYFVQLLPFKCFHVETWT